MDAKQFQKEIVDKTLVAMGSYRKNVSQLIMGVIWQETGGANYVKQLGNGPALGFIQMEPATHDDIWDNFLCYRKPLAETICNFSMKIDEESKGHPHHLELMYSLPYQIAMCRAHFLRVKDAIPKEGDVKELAAYWKKFYNTEKGAGTEEEFIKNFPDEIL